MPKLTRLRSVHVLTLTAALAVPLADATMPRGNPADVGMSAERLARLDQAIDHHLTPGNTNPAGVVTAVARRGRLVHLQGKGVMNIESKKPMATDSIFRLMSASKVIVSAAVLMLVEEDKIGLTDPVSRFIPEFARIFQPLGMKDTSFWTPAADKNPRLVTLYDQRGRTSPCSATSKTP